MNVLITGTSRGIGLELARLFAAEGHKVIAASRNSAPVSALGLDNITAVETDLTDKGSIRQLVEAVGKEFKCLDILIHNAGHLVNTPFEKLSEEEVIRTYQVNLFSVMNLNAALLPLIRKSSHRHILHIGSMGGVQGSSKFKGLAAYSSSKGALSILTECLAEEWKDEQIKVNCLALGAVQTEMLAEAFPGFEAPLKAHEMAEYIMKFALEGCKHYNGKVLSVSLSTP